MSFLLISVILVGGVVFVGYGMFSDFWEYLLCDGEEWVSDEFVM